MIYSLVSFIIGFYYNYELRLDYDFTCFPMFLSKEVSCSFQR